MELHFFCINSSTPSVAYMRQWTGLSLVHVMACRLFGAKPLPEPMLDYCQLDSWEQVSVKFEFEFYHCHSRKCIWKCSLPKWRPFCPGGDELSHYKGCVLKEVGLNVPNEMTNIYVCVCVDSIKPWWSVICCYLGLVQCYHQQEGLGR